MSATTAGKVAHASPTLHTVAESLTHQRAVNLFNVLCPVRRYRHEPLIWSNVKLRILLVAVLCD